MLQDILKDFEELYKPYCIHSSLCTDSQSRDKEKIKDFITTTYNTAIKEHNLNCKQGIQAVEIMNIQKEARKELVEEILREMPKEMKYDNKIGGSGSIGYNLYRHAVIDLLNKKI